MLLAALPPGWVAALPLGWLAAPPLGWLAAPPLGWVAAPPLGWVAAPPLGWVAAGLIDVIGPLLVVAFWVVRQVVVSLREQREQDKARKAAEERGEQWPPAEPEPRGEEPALEVVEAAPPRQVIKPDQIDLRSEVEEFLRRASQGNAAPAPKPAKKPPLDPFDEPPRRQRPKSVVPQAKTPPVVGRKRSSSDAPLRPDGPRNLDVQVDTPPQRVTLRRLPESQLAENAAHLGESIATADDRVEARLHEKFDHRLGSLTSRPSSTGTTPTEPTSAAGRIRKALIAPGGAREAVILSEILRSPADRI